MGEQNGDPTGEPRLAGGRWAEEGLLQERGPPAKDERFLRRQTEKEGAEGKSVRKAPREELLRPAQGPKASEMGAEGMGPTKIRVFVFILGAPGQH